MTTVTFELYSDELFFEVSVETENPDALIEKLFSMPNVRNIQY